MFVIHWKVLLAFRTLWICPSSVWLAQFFGWSKIRANIHTQMSDHITFKSSEAPAVQTKWQTLWTQEVRISLSKLTPVIQNEPVIGSSTLFCPRHLNIKLGFDAYSRSHTKLTVNRYFHTEYALNHGINISVSQSAATLAQS